MKIKYDSHLKLLLFLILVAYLGCSSNDSENYSTENILSRNALWDVSLNTQSNVIAYENGISFRMGRSNLDLNNSEFLVYQLVNNRKEWRAITNWTRWPLPKISIIDEPYTAFRIVYRNLIYNTKGEKRIGNFTIVNGKPREASIRLLRMLTSNFNEKDGLEINLYKSSLLLLPYIREISGLDLQLTKTLELPTPGSEPDFSYEIPKELVKSSFDNYLNKKGLTGKSAEEKVVLFISKTIYDSYQYGNDNDGYFYSINQPVLNCNTFSFLLRYYLENIGFSSNFISIEYKGAHAFVEVNYSNGDKAVVDLTSGRYYLGGLQTLVNFEPITDINLGNTRVDIDLRKLILPGAHLWISTEFDDSRSQSFHQVNPEEIIL